MFDLQETRGSFNYPVKGANLGQEFYFIGEFLVMDLAGFIKFKDGIKDDVAKEGPDNVWLPYVEKCFVGWVNLPGQPETWIADGGEPVECTPERLQKLLSRPGVAQAIVYAFLDACRATEVSTVATGEDDGLGNSRPSPDDGTTETPERGSGS